MRFIRYRIQTAATGINKKHPLVIMMFHRMRELRRFDLDFRQVQYNITSNLNLLHFAFGVFLALPFLQNGIKIPGHKSWVMQAPPGPALLHQVSTRVLLQFQRPSKMSAPLRGIPHTGFHFIDTLFHSIVLDLYWSVAFYVVRVCVSEWPLLLIESGIVSLCFDLCTLWFIHP